MVGYQTTCEASGRVEPVIGLPPPPARLSPCLRGHTEPRVPCHAGRLLGSLHLQAMSLPRSRERASLERVHGMSPPPPRAPLGISSAG